MPDRPGCHPTGLLVAASDELLRTSLAAAFGPDAAEGLRDLRCVAQAATGAEATQQLGRHRPELTLAHTGLSDVDTIEWVRGAARTSGSRILVLHPRADVDVLVAALEAGAAGFQTTELTTADLAGALRAVRRGEACVPRRMLGGLLHSLIQRRRVDDEAQARLGRLSRREQEVLRLLGGGLDHDAIAAVLVISPQTARTHIQNVLGKLEVHSRLEATNFAIEHGFVDPARGDPP